MLNSCAMRTVQKTVNISIDANVLRGVTQMDTQLGVFGMQKAMRVSPKDHSTAIVCHYS